MARPGTFPKGVSGNPGGRPKSDFNLSAECQKYGAEVVGFMIKVLRGEPVEKHAVIGGKVKKVKVCPSFEQQQRSAEWFADRGFGKAATVLAGEGGVGPATITITLEKPLPEIAKQ